MHRLFRHRPPAAAGMPAMAGTAPVAAPGVPAAAAEIDSPVFAGLDEAAYREMAAGRLAGAVILAGRRDKILYRKAFGYKAVRPGREAMTADTVFDLASLTKAAATTIAVMQLAGRGRLDVNRPVADYWPAFAQNGKAHVTLRQLLTHSSGLRAAVNGTTHWSGYLGAVQAVAADRPVSPPGTVFRYSDANFVALGDLVRRVSGLPLDEYWARNIYRPLGLKDTGFNPPAAERARIAPTDLRRGEVQDPTAHRMGGVAGHAGLFSTADDLAVLAGMLANGGVWHGRRILDAGIVRAMAQPNGVPGSATRRGLGWDMVSPYSKAHSTKFPKGSFGHTGYTGTSLRIDPASGSYLIVLTSRLHPDGKGDAKPLRAAAAAAAARALGLAPPAETADFADAGPETGAGQADAAAPVQTGLQILAADGFAALAGKNVGLITNHTGIDGQGRTTLELLRRAKGVNLRAVFSPEHGLSGTRDEKIADGTDAASGLPVYSLYGRVKKPGAAMLAGLDALVYDIQDVGARFYTYITTMAYAMEAAAAQGLDFYVLDRPDPVNADIVQGPVMDAGLKSFTGYFPLPVRYGMTAGELAGLFNAENGIGARLHVVPMQGYRRQSWFDDAGLPWVNPSPNIRSLDQAILYAGVGLVEAADLSVGRGTDTPFELVGAPWISGRRLAGFLNGRDIPGVAIRPAGFRPGADRYQAQPCEGIRLQLTDRAAFDAPLLGLELANALYRLYPARFDIDRTRGMFGSSRVVDAVKQGRDPKTIRRDWQPALEAFRQMRAKYLLY